MTLKQASKFSYETLVYNQFLLTGLLYKREPYHCLCYQSESNTTTLVIFSRTQSGTTTTRHMKLKKAAAESVLSRLQSDYDITVERLGNVEME